MASEATSQASRLQASSPPYAPSKRGVPRDRGQAVPSVLSVRFETGPAAQAALKLAEDLEWQTLQPPLPEPSGVDGHQRRDRFTWCWGQNPGLPARQTRTSPTGEMGVS